MFHLRLSSVVCVLISLAASPGLPAFADDHAFRSEDPIGRTVVAKIGKTRTLLGYFCLHRESNERNSSTCVQAQFASSPEDQITHDPMGNLSSSAWTTLGPVFTMETAATFFAKMKNTQDGLAFYSRVWNSGIWDRSEEGWQYKPKEIASRDLADFSRLLDAEGSSEKNPDLKNRKDFVGWWLDGRRGLLIRIDDSSVGTVTVKTYKVKAANPGNRVRAHKIEFKTENDGSLTYQTGNLNLDDYSGDGPYLDYQMREGAHNQIALYRKNGRIHLAHFAMDSLFPYITYNTYEMRQLTDDEVKQTYKVRN